MSNAEWQRSFEFNETRRPAGIDDFLASTVRLRDPPAVYGFVLNRPCAAPRFGPRECRLAHLVLRSVARELRRGLALSPGGLFVDLPERLQATLRCLLEGDGEKEAALRLGLSHPTIHEYVTDLYRHFGVSGRAELLARCYRHCSPALAPAGGEVGAGLPPRLRQTLLCLLEGDSEKQAAVRLGLSRHTVHEYIGTLYRRFGVNSHIELVTMCYRGSQLSGEPMVHDTPP
jgi:DNA-binding NarL/FixJ family response regulator